MDSIQHWIQLQICSSAFLKSWDRDLSTIPHPNFLRLESTDLQLRWIWRAVPIPYWWKNYTCILEGNIEGYSWFFFFINWRAMSLSQGRYSNNCPIVQYKFSGYFEFQPQYPDAGKLLMIKLIHIWKMMLKKIKKPMRNYLTLDRGSAHHIQYRLF